MEPFDFLLSYLMRAEKSLLLAIDGRCAAGKTTLAEKLRLALDGRCGIVHTDDFYLPFARRTADGEQQPAGHMDIERLRREILLPLSDGREAVYRPYDCHADRFLPSHHLNPAQCIIVEGSYACHPRIRALYDLRVFLDISGEEQLARLRRRNPALVDAFQTLWIPKEEYYFQACRVRESCDFMFRNES